MKKWKQWFFTILSIVLIFSFAVPPQVQASAATVVKPELHYVALGDSLADGILNNGSSGEGYPEKIERNIESNSSYIVNLKNYGVAGYETTDVIRQLTNKEVRTALAQAQIVTYDAGANDVLKVLLQYTQGDFSKFNPNDPKLMQLVQAKILEVAGNIGGTIKEIRTLNPNAQIYVMGYYNALYYIPNVQEAVEKLIAALNQAIQTAAESTQAIYVPTIGAFNGKYTEYLPNIPTPNIHPTTEGYEAIAGEFLRKIVPNLPIAWLFGEGEPTADVGYPTDRYVDVKNLVSYAKGEKGWEKQAGDFVKGQGAPASNNGKVGDIYYDQSTSQIYFKTADQSWLLIGKYKIQFPDEGNGNQNGENPGKPNEGGQPQHPNNGDNGNQTDTPNSGQPGGQIDAGKNGSHTGGTKGETKNSAVDNASQSKTTDTEKAKTSSSKLPNTATNHGVMILTGLSMIAAAFVIRKMNKGTIQL